VSPTCGAGRTRNKITFYNKFWESRDVVELDPWHQATVNFLKGQNLSRVKILDVGCGVGKIFWKITANWHECWHRSELRSSKNCFVA